MLELLKNKNKKPLEEGVMERLKNTREELTQDTIRQLLAKRRAALRGRGDLISN